MDLQASTGLSDARRVDSTMEQVRLHRSQHENYSLPDPSDPQNKPKGDDEDGRGETGMGRNHQFLGPCPRRTLSNS
jgi:hypothetical protein